VAGVQRVAREWGNKGMTIAECLQGCLGIQVSCCNRRIELAASVVSDWLNFKYPSIIAAKPQIMLLPRIRNQVDPLLPNATAELTTSCFDSMLRVSLR